MAYMWISNFIKRIVGKKTGGIVQTTSFYETTISISKSGPEIIPPAPPYTAHEDDRQSSSSRSSPNPSR